MKDGESDAEVISFADIDSAIAHAMADVGDGGVVAVHSDECEMTDDDEDSCTCEPLELVVGAKA